jgi:glucuronate isomerase
LTYLDKLSASVDFEINNYSDCLKAIDARIQYFNENGCRLSDFGVGEALVIEDFIEEEVLAIFKKKLEGGALSTLEINKYRSSLFIHLG